MCAMQFGRCIKQSTCHKIAYTTSEGPSERRISKGTTDGLFVPLWFFASLWARNVDGEWHFKKQLSFYIALIAVCKEKTKAANL